MKRFTYLIVILFLSATSYSQGHFVPAFTGYGVDHMNINIITATIGGVALDAGDEIAVFDGSICCGVTILTQPINILDVNTFGAIAASRTDPGLSNGYTDGHVISCKFWDSSAGKEISGIAAEYHDGNTGFVITAPTFTANATTFVKLSVAAPVNHAPVSNAGPDQSVNEGDPITLDGSASSDPDSDPLTYLWTAPSGITLSSTTDAKPTFTAPEVTVNTDYTFSLVVNDGTLNSPADQVVITVKQVNKPPVANAGPDQSVNEGDFVTLDGTASTDPDTDPLTYLWTAPAGITLSSVTASKPTFTAPEVMINTNYTFSLVVNDGKANSLADQVIVIVKQVNKAPVANAGPDQSPDENTLVTLDGSASSDPDNDPLTYQWTAPAGIILSSATVANPTFTAPEVTINTNYTFSLVVNDGTLNSPTDQIIITVKQVNKPPVANAGTDQSVNEGALVALDGTASSDPENDLLTYLWTAPAGIILSSVTASKPTFIAPEVMINTNYMFSLVVNDGKANSPSDQVVVTVKQVNKAPVANAGPDQSVSKNSLYALDGSASFDPDNDVLTFTWIAPAGITLSSSTIVNPTFTTPDIAVNTDYTFSLVVNDGTLNSPVDQVVITVKQDNKPPVAYAGPDQSQNEGVQVTLDGTGSSDPDNDPLTYHWTAPAGITLNSTTIAKPTFIAPEVMINTDYTFSLVVNDGTVNSPADQVVVTVMQVNKAPVANAGPDQTVNEGATVTLDGSASSDPDNNALTFLWTAPAGIILSSATVAKPTFTAPEVMINTDYTFSLIVNDGTVDSPADQVVVTVKKVNQAPVYTSAKLFKANEDEPVEILLEGTDPESDPIIFSIENLPSFLTLTKKSDTSAVLSGTFTSKNIGDNLYHLTLSDGLLTTLETITIAVTHVDHAPFVTDSIKNVSVDKSSPDQVLDLKTVFADVDPGDVLSYSVLSNTNDKVVQAKITGTDLTLSFSTENTGLSEIVITAISNGKEVQSKFKVEVKIPTGIAPLFDEADVQLYPNPTKGNVQLKFSQTPKSGTWITIFSISGNVISKSLAKNKEENLNLKGYPSGLYFIKIGRKTPKTYKIVME